MKKFDNITIRNRMIALVTFVALATAILGGSALYSLSTIHNNLDKFLSVVVLRTELNQQMRIRSGYGGLIHNFKNYILRGEEKNITAFNKDADAIRAIVQRYRQLGTFSDVSELANDKRLEMVDAYSKSLIEAQKLRFEGKLSLTEIDLRVKIDDAPFFKAYKAYDEHLKKRWEEGTAELKTIVASTQKVQVGLILLTLTLLTFFGLAMTRSITRPLLELMAASSRLKEGNLDTRVKISGENEIGMLANAFNGMAETMEENNVRDRQQLQELRDAVDIKEKVDGLRRHVETIAAGDLRNRVSTEGDDDLARLGQNLDTMTESLAKMAKQVDEASSVMTSTLGQVQSATNAQAAGASEQAAAVAETSATLTEIKATSNQTQEKAEALGKAAERAREESDLGMRAVEQAVAGMRDVRSKVEGIAENILALSEQTEQIGEITRTVNNLAQQLKMLALNASIEAGKAGEAGKGFAVVASEVKDLAEQSQQATNQVQKILQDIQRATAKAVMATEEGTKGADEGVILVEQTGNTVNNMSEVIRETTVASQQIVAAVRQEAAGIDQISIAMNDINATTTSFVASSAQTLEGANNLVELAAKLRTSASAYKT